MLCAIPSWKRERRRPARRWPFFLHGSGPVLLLVGERPLGSWMRTSQTAPTQVMTHHSASCERLACVHGSCYRRLADGVCTSCVVSGAEFPLHWVHALRALLLGRCWLQYWMCLYRCCVFHSCVIKRTMCCYSKGCLVPSIGLLQHYLLCACGAHGLLTAVGVCCAR